MKNPFALFIIGLTLSAIGCSESEPARQKWGGKPATPPAYPAAQTVPIDRALQQAAAAELLKDESSTDAVLRAHAIEAWQETGAPQARAAALKGLRDTTPLVRFASEMAAGSLRLADAKPQLLKLADEPDKNVRVAARYALHRLGDTRRSHELEKFATDWDAGVRGNTVMVFGLLGEPSALKILGRMTHDRVPAVLLQVAEARWRLGDKEGLADLVAASVSQYPDDQIAAYLAIAAPHDQRVIEHIRGGLTGDYPEIRLVAARAMGMLGSDEGYGIATLGAKSADPRQRSLAALAFGSIHRTDAQPALAILIKDNFDEVRLSAATAILQLGFPIQ